MINHPCSACGHWMHSSEHLIGVMVRCRECGERIEVPAQSAANVPRATQPSGILRHSASTTDTPDDPLDRGPVEVGWQRLQDTTSRLLPKGNILIGLLALVIVAGMSFLIWWLLSR
jgi:hypothetical protein